MQNIRGSEPPRSSYIKLGRKVVLPGIVCCLIFVCLLRTKDLRFMRYVMNIFVFVSFGIYIMVMAYMVF